MQTTPGTSLTDPSTPARGRLRPEIVLWITVALTAYGLDQASKWWAEDALADGQPRQVVGELLQFRLVYNPGAAFSTGTGYTALLTIVALAVIVVVVRLASKLQSRAWAVALGLILGGALGNVTDRLSRGYVVDFVDIGIGDFRWYTFNVADAAISTSIVMLIGAALIPSLVGLGERRSDG